MKLSKVKLGMKVVFTCEDFGVFCNHSFAKGDTGKIVGIDLTDPNYSVLVENDKDVDWVSHEDVADYRVAIPQSVFDGQEERWIYAARDKDGVIGLYTRQPVRDNRVWFTGEDWEDAAELDIELPMITVKWKKSLIKRGEE